jgi:hypothetical protein
VNTHNWKNTTRASYKRGFQKMKIEIDKKVKKRFVKLSNGQK